MLNSIQLFGVILLGGLASGEFSRRICRLPRTTGYVVFGLLMGRSGCNYIPPLHVQSAEPFIDLALGLILFELGTLLPRTENGESLRRIRAGALVALLSGLSLAGLFFALGFSGAMTLLASALCLATSPAITIATCSDVGASGHRTGLLYTMVAVTGCIAFVLVTLVSPFLDGGETISNLTRLNESFKRLALSLLLGGACATIVLLAVRHLQKQGQHQHLLLLGTIVLGVGSATQLGISAFLPMLVFGVLVRALDRDGRVIAIRIASDARVFLVIAFVLAGAALDVADLFDHWSDAVLIAMVRLAGQTAGVQLAARWLGLSPREGVLLAIGLQPMSSVALVLLNDVDLTALGMEPEAIAVLMATILLQQLLGPLATQTAIKGFGEARRLQASPEQITPSVPPPDPTHKAPLPPLRKGSQLRERTWRSSSQD